jgi:hypothetical protein
MGQQRIEIFGTGHIRKIDLDSISTEISANIAQITRSSVSIRIGDGDDLS